MSGCSSGRPRTLPPGTGQGSTSAGSSPRSGPPPLRVEFYRDAEGVISGMAQTLVEGTLTVEYRPWDILILKLEGRYDHSTASVFSTSDAASGRQPEQGQETRSWSCSARWPPSRRASEWLDLIFVAVTVVFFAVSWAYVRGCERLWRTGAMNLEYLLGERRGGAAHRLPRLRAAPPGALLRPPMTARRLGADRPVLRARPRSPPSRWASTCSASSRATASPLPRVLGPVERFLFRLSRRRPEARSRPGCSTPARAAGLQPRSACWSPTRILRLQHVLPLNPQELRAGGSGAGLQHRRQLHHQHQLAGVRRRVDDELPHPDGGAGLAQLHLRRRGHRRGARARARAHPPARRPTAPKTLGQLLGRPRSAARSTCCFP